MEERRKAREVVKDGGEEEGQVDLTMEEKRRSGGLKMEEEG